MRVAGAPALGTEAPFTASGRGVQEGIFFGRRIHGDLDVRAIGIPWAFFHVFPQSVVIAQDVGTHGRIASGAQHTTCSVQVRFKPPGFLVP